MILKIFAIYDSKAKAYLPPFFLPEPAVAVRVFSNAANDKDHQFGANPGDYTLFHLGGFDDDTGKITTKATPRNLGIAQQFVKAEYNEDQEELDLKPVEKLNTDNEELTQ